MEATVTITLKEIEDLKHQLEIAKEQKEHYRKMKEFTLTIDTDLYDSKKGNRIHDYRTMVYGSVQLLEKDCDWRKIQEFHKQSFEKIINESEVLRFYNKFPKWVHKLFKCE